MVTSIYIDGVKCGTFISHESSRKDFVLWAGFTLVGVYVNIEDAKKVVSDMHKIECPDSLLEFK